MIGADFLFCIHVLMIIKSYNDHERRQERI